MLLGSYPELAMRAHDEAREWYSSYLGTYLERDVRLANEVGKFSDFQTLLRLLAARTSQEYNASYLVFRLRPWHANIGKRLVKRPKLYFWDTGLVCHLTGIRDNEALQSGPLGGPVFENLVVAEILKAAAHRGLEVQANYFRESNGLESDLLLRRQEDGRRWVVDVKSSHTPKAGWMDGLGRVAALALEPSSSAACRRVVIYNGKTKRDWPSPGCDFLNLEDAIGAWQVETKPTRHAKA
jgi:predicted AAA+ superfamily ATPase